MPLQKLVKLLANVPYFSGLDAASLTAIAEQAHSRAIQRDQAMFTEGDRDQGLCIIETGWVKVVKMSTDGREQIIDFAGPGQALNALSVFAEVPSPATAIALEDSRIWTIQQQTLLALLENHPQLARSIIQTIANRFQHLLGLVEDLSLRSVEQRLARLILSQAGGGSIQRRNWATQTEIAARIGTVPDVLSRVFQKLAKEGLIEVSRHQIKIIDPEGLRQKAQLD